MATYKEHFEESLDLLKRLIAQPSPSRSEQAVSGLVLADLRAHGYEPTQIGLNLMARGHHYNPSKPNLLLNSHMDTVKPVQGWQTDPFTPHVEDGRLIGLGSNDAGASLVSLLHTFYLLDSYSQKYNPIFLATAQEEVNGDGGMKMVLTHLPEIEVALIGEPTGMQPAIAEKGLMVLDFTVEGKAGHAARAEGINALYRAMDVISMLRDFRFEQDSPFLGPVRMTVTMVHAGTQHNVIPDTCTFTADVRSNELYSNSRIFEMVGANLPEWCHMRARSFNLNSSRLDPGHPIVRKAVSLGLEPYGSPTLSDQAVLSCPSFKIGPGDSARSHTAGEYIRLEELEAAVPAYMALLDGLEI